MSDPNEKKRRRLSARKNTKKIEPNVMDEELKESAEQSESSELGMEGTSNNEMVGVDSTNTINDITVEIGNIMDVTPIMTDPVGGLFSLEYQNLLNKKITLKIHSVDSRVYFENDLKNNIFRMKFNNQKGAFNSRKMQIGNTIANERNAPAVGPSNLPGPHAPFQPDHFKSNDQPTASSAIIPNYFAENIAQPTRVNNPTTSYYRTPTILNSEYPASGARPLSENPLLPVTALTLSNGRRIALVNMPPWVKNQIPTTSNAISYNNYVRPDIPRPPWVGQPGFIQTPPPLNNTFKQTYGEQPITNEIPFQNVAGKNNVRMTSKNQQPATARKTRTNKISPRNNPLVKNRSFLPDQLPSTSSIRGSLNNKQPSPAFDTRSWHLVSPYPQGLPKPAGQFTPFMSEEGREGNSGGRQEVAQPSALVEPEHGNQIRTDQSREGFVADLGNAHSRNNAFMSASTGPLNLSTWSSIPKIAEQSALSRSQEMLIVSGGEQQDENPPLLVESQHNNSVRSYQLRSDLVGNIHCRNQAFASISTTIPERSARSLIDGSEGETQLPAPAAPPKSEAKRASSAAELLQTDQTPVLVEPEENNDFRSGNNQPTTQAYFMHPLGN